MNTMISRMQRFSGIGLEIALGIFLLWVFVAALNPPAAHAAGAASTAAIKANAVRSLLAIAGTVCLQDDSNGNSIQFESATGNYCFSTASGLTISGVGTVSIKGTTVTLQHFAPDRRVIASTDESVKTGKASAQYFPNGTTVFTVADRNTTGDICTCAKR